MRNSRILHGVMVLCIFQIACGSDGANWPQWQGPTRDNRSAETGLLKVWPESGPKLLWSVDGLGEGFATVSIANGLIYTTGMIDGNGFLLAIDMEGNVKWKQMYGPEWSKDHPGTRGTPTVNSGCVFINSGLGAISCYDAFTGQRKWTTDVFKQFNGGNYPKWGIAESPLVVGNAVICTPGGNKTGMVALDKETGQEIWVTKSINENAGYCTAGVIEKEGRTLLVTLLSNTVIAVDAGTGEILWQYDCSNYQQKPKEINPNTPLYYDNCIYVTSGYGKGGAKLRIASDPKIAPTKEWANFVLDCQHGGVVLVDGYIYGTNMAGEWVCLDWKDGGVMYQAKGIGKGSVTYVDGMLYCFGENGTVALVKPSPDGFNLISSFKVPKGSGMMWAHPVICGGRMYVRHGDVLLVYDVKS